MAVVRDGGNMKIYIDGALDRTKALDGSTSSGFGAMTFTGNTARIDDVRVHDGALSTGQVSDLASPAFPEALWAYYPFEGDASDDVWQRLRRRGYRHQHSERRPRAGAELRRQLRR